MTRPLTVADARALCEAHGKEDAARNKARVEALEPLLAVAKALWADRDAAPTDHAAVRRLYDAWRDIGAAIARAEGGAT